MKPQNLDEETIEPTRDQATPTFTHIGNYFFDYAALLLDFYNATVNAEDQDEFTRYEILLKFDGEMRAMYAEKLPQCLSPRMPLKPGWPKWIVWARRLHQASVNHKIITMHQNYLSKSFKNVRFTYSRWACTASARNIINLYGTRELNEPQWWVEQAFVVTAGICLILDLFHRADAEPEVQEYLACVNKAIVFLQQFFTSSVAVHGVRLLRSLLQEYTKLHKGLENNVPLSPALLDRAEKSLPDTQRVTQTLPANVEIPWSFDESAQFNFDIDALGFEDLMDYLPVESSLDHQVLFDSMCSVGNGQPI